MRRLVGYVVAWSLATTVAIGVSWYGVRDVLDGAVFAEPPLSAGAVRLSPSASPDDVDPTDSSTARPERKKPKETPGPTPAGVTVSWNAAHGPIVQTDQR